MKLRPLGWDCTLDGKRRMAARTHQSGTPYPGRGMRHCLVHGAGPHVATEGGIGVDERRRLGRSGLHQLASYDTVIVPTPIGSEPASGQIF
jgi:hypothetical protein